MLSVIDEILEHVDWPDLDMLLGEALFPSDKADTLWDTSFVNLITSVFEVLLVAPTEYLARASKSALIYHATVADLMICNSGVQPTADLAVCMYATMTVRKWLSLALASGLQVLTVCNELKAVQLLY